jgi:LacI family transcriptional regulator
LDGKHEIGYQSRQHAHPGRKWVANQKRRLIRTDVAKLAGVSVATVDRVLNGRGSVKDETARRIMTLATELGYSAGVVESELRLSVLIQDPWHLYLREIVRHLTADQIDPLKRRYKLTVHYMSEIAPQVPDTSPQAFAAKIDELAKTSDVIAGNFPQHPLVLHAVGRAMAAGVPVVTMATDLRDPRRAAYVGPDHRVAGRTAGKLMGMLLKGRTGKIVITSDSVYSAGTSFIAIEERDAGFKSVIHEQFPDLTVISAVERITNNTEVRDKLMAYLDDESVLGIFNAGGRNSHVISTIRQSGRTPDNVVTILSELSTSSHEALLKGEVYAILGHSAKRVADVLLETLLTLGRGESVEPLNIIPTQIFLDENVSIIDTPMDAWY